jgi:hypothetical protein
MTEILEPKPQFRPPRLPSHRAVRLVHALPDLAL